MAGFRALGNGQGSVASEAQCLAGDAVQIAPVSHLNSLQTGNFTGKITISGLQVTILRQETTMPQDFSANSLSKLSGKFF
jgi:hypothetical protein